MRGFEPHWCLSFSFFPSNWTVRADLNHIDGFLFLFTLCMYAQQGYAFGRIGLCVCMYIYIYLYVIIWSKKLAV